MIKLFTVFLCVAGSGATLVLCNSPVASPEFEANPAIKFDLLPENIDLLGGRFYQGSRQGRLPYWFDFTLFKKVYNKTYENKDDNQCHHVKYVETCAKILRKRVLFRILGDSHDYYIDRDSDKLDQWDAKSPAKLGVDPIALGVKLVREELARVESANQLIRYQEDFYANRTEVFKLN